MRQLNEIFTDQLDAANPIIELEFDEVENDITQYCQYQDLEIEEAA